MMRFNKYNKFDLSYEDKLTCKMGDLVPIMCQEVVPGDRFRCRDSVLVKLAPMLAPIMHNVDIFTHYFYVPNRLLWSNWDKFITGGEDGTDSSVHPYVTSPAGGFSEGSLADYLGLPLGTYVDSEGVTQRQIAVDKTINVSALPFRAVALIYNEWYRNQNVTDKVGFSAADGADVTTNTSMLKRNWEKDYFTSCLESTQRGPVASLPLGTEAPVSVYGNGKTLGMMWNNGSALQNVGTGAAGGTLGVFSNTNVNVGTTLGNPMTAVGQMVGVTNNPTYSGLVGKTDLRNATAANVNDLRLAFQVQRFMEKQMRGGARLVETILTHFGVRVSDSRIQRPLYLGGGRSPLLVSEVLQTSSTDNTSPQGNPVGRGIGSQIANSFKGFFEEHGFVVGFLSIMPRTGYHQGVERKWTRQTKYDYYWPVLSHLGEQAVKNKEIYVQGTSADEGTFGFQPIYEDYRRNFSKVHGAFRTSLMYWTMNRQFTELPTLSDSFVQATPTKRIFAVADQSVDDCYVDIWHSFKALRRIPKKGDPGMIDHG